MPYRETTADFAGEKKDPVNLRRNKARIERRPRSGAMVCSFAQERLWFIDQLAPGNPAYNIPGGIRLTGELDSALLARSLYEIVRRHEILRVRFEYVDGEVSQVVGPVAVPFEVIDVSGMGPQEREEIVKVQSAIEARQGFDLAHGPLLRTKLLRLAPAEHVLLLTMHHIVSDGWSIKIMTRELTQLYGAFSEKRPSPLPELEIQYGDFALWQRDQVQGEALTEQLQYWRKQLDGVSVLELATNRERRSATSSECASVSFCISRELTERLQHLSRWQGVTSFMTLLAVLQVLLARYSGQGDVTVGTPIASRPAEAENLIGCFLNTLVMRTDVSGNPRVGELLRRVRQTALEAYARSDIPFEKVVEELQPRRDQNRSPFFSVLLAFGAAPPEPLELPGLKADFTVGDSGIAKFDLILSLELMRGELYGKMDYKTGLFTEEGIRRFVGYFQKLLEGIVGEGDRRVLEIPLLPLEERSMLLYDWNVTNEFCTEGLCIHQLFEQRVRNNPDALAVVCGDESLSYQELNDKANRLANHLIGLGVKPNDRVAICVERSVAMVIGLLGILKAGAAYVPLDPGYPSERLRQVLADAGPKILLCDAVGHEALGEIDLREVRAVDLSPFRQSQSLPPEWENLSTADPDPKQLGLSSRNLAYVIYTSGSTGVPKGVMVEHAQVVRLFASTDEAFGFNEQDVWCLFHSFAFDFSVWELWGALRYGGRLIVVPREVARSSQEFYRLVCGQGVTVLNQTPSAFKAFIQAQAQEPLQHRLRYVIFGGEALEPSILKPWYRSHSDGQPQLVNMYGITETTVHVTYRALRSGDTEQSGSPIGTRLSDLRIYLLDAYGEPVPLGAVGEIYVGGAGVARGYLNRPELTAERFLEDPFCSTAGGRMYRTGDLARYLPDGSIEFLGRNDDQVKIRGFRIELGEIEARLAEHPLVEQAVVIARQDQPEEKRLVAYVVPAAAETLADSLQISAAADLAGVLRSHLLRRLPEYMIPAAFVELKDFPLTPNGKLDRKAFPPPEGAAFARRSYEEPRGEMEQAIAGIWSELLAVERVGRHDDFFELGGHSLLVVRLKGLLQSTLGVRLDLSELFNHPQLDLFAKRVLIVSIEQEFDSAEFESLVVEDHEAKF